MTDINDPVVQEKLRRVLEKLGVDAPAETQGPARPIEEVVAPQQPTAPVVMDWSQFDLHPEIAHLYPGSRPVQTPEGVKHVATLDQFEFKSGPYSKLGAMVNDMVNGSDQWGIATVFGGGAGLGVVLFTRKVPYALPSPRLLRNDATMPAVPKQDELQAAEDAAIDWIKAEGASVVDVDDNVLEQLEIPFTETSEGMGDSE